MSHPWRFAGTGAGGKHPTELEESFQSRLAFMETNWNNMTTATDYSSVLYFGYTSQNYGSFLIQKILEFYLDLEHHGVLPLSSPTSKRSTTKRAEIWYLTWLMQFPRKMVGFTEPNNALTKAKSLKIGPRCCSLWFPTRWVMLIEPGLWVSVW